MLIIRRRPSESFLIGDEIEVQVLEVKGTHVKLGIQAPKKVQILRSEVLEIQQANLASACAEIPRKQLSRLIQMKK